MNNVAPTITNLSGDTSGNEGESFNFSADVSDPAGANDPLSYTWDFGDGSAGGTNQSVSHVYADNGTFTVTVTVSDGDSGITNQTTAVTVNNVAPTITNLSGDTSGNEGESFNFSAAATDPAAANDPLTYTWDFGDGSEAGAGQSVNHVYADNGTFTITLTVSDGDGGTTNQTAAVTVNNLSPAITNLPVDTQGDEGASFSFSIDATDPGQNDVLSYTWNFGDGSDAVVGQLVSHIYRDDAIYIAEVTISDEEGAITNHTTSVTVNNLPPTITNLSDSASGNEGDTFNFSVEAADPAGTNDPLTYTWDFGDGTGQVLGQSVGHGYADDGIFTVTVTVNDGDGGTVSQTTTVTVNNAPPTITNLSGDTSGNEGDTFNFSVEATDPAGVNDPLTYTWSFGDGSGQVVGQSVSHVYPDSGTFTVIVTVRDNDGGESIQTTDVTVSVVGLDRTPRMEAVENDSATVGETKEIEVTVFDPNPNSQLTLSAFRLGSGAQPTTGSVTLVPEGSGTRATAIVSWTSGNQDDGQNISFQVTATDETGLTDKTVFVLSVGEVENLPPRILPIQEVYLDFGQNERVLGQKTRERENAKTGQRKELDTVSFSTMADWINNSVL